MTASASDFKGVGGLRRILNAFRYTGRGIRYAFTHEAAFRQEVLAMVVLAPTAVMLPVSALERLLLVLLMLLVLIVELLNTAIEVSVDRVSLDLHPLAGRAKDLGSAAVGFSLLMNIVAWVVIAGPLLF